MVLKVGQLAHTGYVAAECTIHKLIGLWVGGTFLQQRADAKRRSLHCAKARNEEGRENKVSTVPHLRLLFKV